ncbi:MAG: hypothetical protein VX033_01780 [Verrucomicrobiota bacterium]|nr:hypothetical protein [Verrucomicrobiota bacterium]
MNKAMFYELFLESLRKELLLSIEASQDAADYATNDESRADSKWDTQGLEASYLAAGQAGMAKKWAVAIEELQSERELLLAGKERVELGALFECAFGDGSEYFYFAGVAGGHEVRVESKTVTIVSPQSPLVHCLLGLRVGDDFVLPNAKLSRLLSVQ